MLYRKMLGAKIHRATVKEANLDYVGSITIPADLLESANILPNEAVCIWNVTRGSRFETYAIVGQKQSGYICINGAAAHLAKEGDIVIIAKFVYLAEDEAKLHQPIVVFVDAHNRITRVERQEEQSNREASLQRC